MKHYSIPDLATLASSASLFEIEQQLNQQTEQLRVACNVVRFQKALTLFALTLAGVFLYIGLRPYAEMGWLVAGAFTLAIGLYLLALLGGFGERLAEIQVKHNVIFEIWKIKHSQAT